MKQVCKIEHTEIFEWYDGLVSGIIKSENLFAFEFLLAFDPDTKRKRFCLVPISQEQATAISQAFKTKSVKALDHQFLSAIFATVRERFLSSDEPKEGASVRLTVASAAEKDSLPIPSFPIIESAIVPQMISTWLDTKIN